MNTPYDATESSVLHEILDTIPEAVFQAEIKEEQVFSVTYASAHFWVLFEMEPRSFPFYPDSTFYNVIFDEDLALLHKTKGQSMENNHLWSMDFRVKLPQKGVCWFRLWAKPGLSDSAVFKWNGSIKDITKKKQHELSLMEDQKRWRFSLEEAGAGFWEWDIKNKRIYRSSQTLHLIGFKEGELSDDTRSWFERIHPEDRPECPDCPVSLDELHRCALCPSGWFSSTDHMEYTYRIQGRDGSYKWVLDRGKVVERDQDGNPTLFFGYILDITSQKKIEASLDAERSLFSHGPTVIFRCKDQPGWPLVYVSSNVQHLLGYSSAELTSESFLYSTLIHANDLARVEMETNQMLEQKKDSYSFSYRLVHRDGKILWVTVTSKVEEHFDEPNRHFIGYVNDIGPTMQSMHRLRTVMNHIHTNILVIDPNTDKILFINESTHSIFGSIEGKLSVDHFWSSFQLPKQATRFQPKNFENEKPIFFNHYLNRWFEIHPTAINWIDGRRVHLLTLSDVTELKEAMHSFQQNEQEKESILQAIPDNIFILDIEKATCFKSYIRSNSPTRNTSKMIGEQPLEKFFTHALIKKILSLSKKAIHSTEIVTFDYELEADFKRLNYEARLIRLTNQRVILVERDVTHTYEMQQATKNALESAENASQTKSQFLANMSHEIRTPMNGMVGYLDLLMETPLSHKQQKYINALNERIEALMHTINSILDLSRIESGQLNLEKNSFNPLHEIESVVEGFLPYAQKNNNHLSIHQTTDFTQSLLGDPYRFRQILNNLIGNALKFTCNGTITVTTGMSPMSSQTMEVFVSIKDTGIGIPKDQIQTLFQPFVQADNSTTRRYGGSGLGLTITKQLIQLLGGSITVESNPLEGSCFTITIPFDTEHPLMQPPSFQQKEVSSPLNPDYASILIIESQNKDRSIFRQLLIKQKIISHFSQNETEALGFLQENSYDAVFMESSFLKYNSLYDFLMQPQGFDWILIADAIEMDSTLVSYFYEPTKWVPSPLTAHKVVSFLDNSRFYKDTHQQEEKEEEN